MNFFMEFHEPDHFFRSWNATFLVLIREKEGLKAIRIFGLKSLVWGRGVV